MLSSMRQENDFRAFVRSKRKGFVKTSLIFWLVCFLYTDSVIGQNDQRIDQLKNVIPPSPNSASLGKYTDWPVSLYTGLVDIDIPIYTLQGREGSVPVSLSYHASGIKVDEAASNVGLGWALNAGGVITRSVRGFPDEEPAGYFQTRQLFNNPGNLSQGMINPSLDEQVQMDVANGARELEPDYFMFNALGKSFTLFFDGSGNIVTQPYSQIKCSVDFTAKLWTVILEDGTKLIFGGSESYVERNICGCFGESSANYISSWMLESVTYPSGEKFSFTYVQTGFTQGTYNETWGKTLRMVYREMSVVAKNISVIESDLGRIDFVYNPATRQDQSGGNALSSIKVFSKTTNQYIKQYNLVQTYSQAVSGNFYSTNQTYFSYRLRLASIEEVSPASTSIKNGIWQFQYNSSNLPHRHSYAQDHWGYYNGATSNSTLLPEVGIFTPPTYTVANRSPNGTSMQAEMLIQITYPTGGSTQFEYEPNGYTDQQGYHMLGGLRIKSMTHLNDIDASKNIKKSFIYEDPYVLHDFQPDDYLFYFTEKEYNCSTTPPTFLGSADWVGRSTAVKSALGSIKGGNIGYGKVTTLVGDNGSNGKIVSEFLNINDLDADASKVFPYPQATSRDWRRGQLLSESFYANGGVTPIRKSVNAYDFLSKGSITTYKAGLSVISSGCLPYQYISNIITRVYYSIITEQIKPLSTTEYQYDNNGVELTTSTNYFYDNPNNLLPVRTETTDSKNNVVKTISRTPLEKADINTATPLTASASAAIDEMVAKNIVSIPLQKETYVAGVLQSRSLINYKKWTSTILKPENVQIQVRDNPLNSRIEFAKYDAFGNLLDQKKSDDILHSYIWDYKNIYPVAECTNADNNSIAYTSFEADSKGNWTYDGLQFTDLSVPTGRKVYNVGTGQISRSGLTSSATYIVSYWTRNSSAFTIAGTVAGHPIQGRVVNGWRYFEHRITGQSQIIINGSGLIDELRLYPQNALMTTMTYDPLIGMTSQCDANNMITYYEYDDFNRLLLVRDMNRNIVKKNCYNYYWQSGSCAIYFNTEQTISFQKECPPGYSGSYVIYNIPAGTYASIIGIAEANQKAIDDLLLNGQVYANALGVCTAVPACTSSNCSGEGNKCVNNNCEAGVKVYTWSYYDSYLGMYTCNFHYEWSDGSWSGDYTEYSYYPCPSIN